MDVDVLVVNWNSGEDLRELLADLERQEGVSLEVTVVDNDSRDGSIDGTRAWRTIEAGANLGYAGGNNLGFASLGLDRPVFVVNPDVRLRDPRVLERLRALLAADARLGGLAPTIRDAEGRVEYRGSRVDLDRARADHNETHVDGWPDGLPAVRELPWVDGAAVLFRPEALVSAGVFDERFFLFYEEVEWCLRAAGRGWKVGIAPGVDVWHARSSSFGGTTKGAYYYWRNLYLLCSLHAGRQLRWRLWWAVRLAGFCLQRGHLRRGQTLQALRGARDALLGRYGPGPEDRR